MPALSAAVGDGRQPNKPEDVALGQAMLGLIHQPPGDPPYFTHGWDGVYREKQLGKAILAFQAKPPETAPPPPPLGSPPQPKLALVEPNGTLLRAMTTAVTAVKADYADL